MELRLIAMKPRRKARRAARSVPTLQGVGRGLIRPLRPLHIRLFYTLGLHDLLAFMLALPWASWQFMKTPYQYVGEAVFIRPLRALHIRLLRALWP